MSSLNNIGQELADIVNGSIEIKKSAACDRLSPVDIPNAIEVEPIDGVKMKPQLLHKLQLKVQRNAEVVDLRLGSRRVKFSYK